MINTAIVIIILVIIFYISQQNNEVVYLNSTLPDKPNEYSYLVRNMDGKQEAANLLAHANYKGLDLIQYLKNKYPADDRFDRLEKNYNPNTLSESSIDSQYTSFTINKGEKMVLCLRNTDNKLIDLNTLMYVYVHELAHIATLQIGHIDEFWTNFKFMLNEAVQMGIYEIVDYSKVNIPYCGIMITNNVLIE